MNVLKPIVTFFLLMLISCGSPDGDESQTIWETASPGPDMVKLEAKAYEAEEYCRTKNLNTDFCIIIGMSMHSGLKRIFIWDFNQSKITDSFLVSHGACDNPWSGDVSKELVKFSNVENSHCSSIGKYI